MIAGSVLIMAGSAILTAARDDSYLLGGRFLLGFGVSIGTSSAPTYALELAPPRKSTQDAHGCKSDRFQSGVLASLGITTASSIRGRSYLQAWHTLPTNHLLSSHSGYL